MNPTTVRIILVVFFIAHGWIHMSLAQVPPPQPNALRTPFFPSWWRNAVDPAWPVSRLGLSEPLVRTAGWVLWLMATVAFSLAGLALLIVPAQAALWQIPAAAGSVVSILLLALYWHPWLPVGVLLDLAILAGIFTGFLTRWMTKS